MENLFAFDLDGTLLTKDKKMLDSTYAVLKQLNGMGARLAIATGRALEDVLMTDSKIRSCFEYIICNNGAYIYDVVADDTLYLGEVSSDFVPVVSKISEETGTFMVVHFSDGSVLRVEPKDSDTNEKWQGLLTSSWRNVAVATPADVRASMIEKKISQISLFGADKEVIKKIHDDLKEEYSEYANFVIANEEFLDINPYGVSKLVGIEQLTEHIGMDIKNVIAFGDSGNDVAMLKGVGLGVAMGNGTDEAKKAAKKKIGTNDEPAIAEFLKEHYLGL